MKARILMLVVACSISACNGQAANERDHVVAEPQSHIESSLFRTDFEDCLDKAGGVTPDMQACIEDEFVFQDAKLQASYDELEASLPDEEDRALEASQQEWGAEREARCSWDARTEGQAQRLEANLCHLRSTAERAKVLEAELK